MLNFLKRKPAQDKIRDKAKKYGLSIINCLIEKYKITIEVDRLDRAMNGSADTFAQELIKNKYAGNIMIIGPRNEYIQRSYIGDVVYFKYGKTQNKK